MRRGGLGAGLLLAACVAQPPTAPAPTAPGSPTAIGLPAPSPTVGATPEPRLDGDGLAALIGRQALRAHLDG